MTWAKTLKDMEWHAFAHHQRDASMPATIEWARRCRDESKVALTTQAVYLLDGAETALQHLRALQRR